MNISAQQGLKGQLLRCQLFHLRTYCISANNTTWQSTLIFLYIYLCMFIDVCVCVCHLVLTRQGQRFPLAKNQRKTSAHRESKHFYRPNLTLAQSCPVFFKQPHQESHQCQLVPDLSRGKSQMTDRSKPLSHR